MKKQFKRLLSLSLVLCLLLSAAPVQAASQESLAEPTQSPAPAEPELSATQAAPATPSTPVAEEVTVLWEDETLSLDCILDLECLFLMRFFKAGSTGEASIEDINHYQKILYIPQARYETIYSPTEYYERNTYNVGIAKRCIHDPY